MVDSISWQRFCRIDIDELMPHPTTLMKIITQCGAGTSLSSAVLVL